MVGFLDGAQERDREKLEGSETEQTDQDPEVQHEADAHSCSSTAQIQASGAAVGSIETLHAASEHEGAEQQAKEGDSVHIDVEARSCEAETPKGAALERAGEGNMQTKEDVNSPSSEVASTGCSMETANAMPCKCEYRAVMCSESV